MRNENSLFEMLICLIFPKDVGGFWVYTAFLVLHM